MRSLPSRGDLDFLCALSMLLGLESLSGSFTLHFSCRGNTDISSSSRKVSERTD